MLSCSVAGNSALKFSQENHTEKESQYFSPDNCIYLFAYLFIYTQLERHIHKQIKV